MRDKWIAVYFFLVVLKLFSYLSFLVILFVNAQELLDPNVPLVDGTLDWIVLWLAYLSVSEIVLLLVSTDSTWVNRLRYRFYLYNMRKYKIGSVRSYYEWLGCIDNGGNVPLRAARWTLQTKIRRLIKGD
jgi:hypothetical protein